MNKFVFYLKIGMATFEAAVSQIKIKISTEKISFDNKKTN